MILTKAQSLAQEEDPTKFDFSIYPEVGEIETLPASTYESRTQSFEDRMPACSTSLATGLSTLVKAGTSRLQKNLLKT